MTTETPVSVPKPSVSIIVWSVLICVVSVWFTVSQLLFVGYIDNATTIKMFLSPLFIIYFLLSNIVPILIGRHYMGVICGYDGSEETLVAANKAYVTWTQVSIFVPIALNIWFPINLSMVYHIPFGAGGYGWSILFSNIASLFLFGLFFYIVFDQKLGRFMKFLPIQKEYLNMGMVKNAALVIMFASVGLLLVVIAPLFKVQQGTPFLQVLTKKSVPLGVIAIVLGIFDMIVQMSGNQRRVTELIEFTTSVAGGNYVCKPLEILSRDDLGILSRTFNEYTHHSRLMVRGIKNSGKVTQEMAAELDDVIANMGQLLNTIAGQSNTILAEMTNQSAGIDETQATVVQITNNIATLDRNLATQATSVTQATAAIEQMVSNIQSVTNILKDNDEMVTQLDEESTSGQQKVEEAVNTSMRIFEESEGLQEASAIIQHIAEQTNMLAMNAAIEAAHAGDAGKGFAVVADEIRKLAEDSNEQSMSISQRLQDLGNSIGTVLENTRTVQEQFGRIYDLSVKIKNQENTIYQAMEEQNQGSREVLIAMQEINENTNMVKQNSAQMLNGSKQVLEEMGHLATSTRQIASSVSMMNDGAQGMTREIESVTRAVEKNSRVSQELLDKTKNLIVD